MIRSDSTYSESENVFLSSLGNFEEQSKISVSWYDFGARNYDPSLGMWFNVDPMLERYHTSSPYHFAGNDPVNNREIDGMAFQSLQDIVDVLFGYENGGSWTSGGGCTPFNSANEALQAGIDYNNRHDSWENTVYTEGAHMERHGARRISGGGMYKYTNGTGNLYTNRKDAVYYTLEAGSNLYSMSADLYGGAMPYDDLEDIAALYKGVQLAFYNMAAYDAEERFGRESIEKKWGLGYKLTKEKELAHLYYKNRSTDLSNIINKNKRTYGYATIKGYKTYFYYPKLDEPVITTFDLPDMISSFGQFFAPSGPAIKLQNGATEVIIMIFGNENERDYILNALYFSVVDKIYNQLKAANGIK